MYDARRWEQRQRTMRNLKIRERLKAAWVALTAGRYFYSSAKANRTDEELLEGTIIKAALMLMIRHLIADNKEGHRKHVARFQMIEAILQDPSVILQSIHDGKPTVIYDCASEEDIDTLLTQDIETISYENS